MKTHFLFLALLSVAVTVRCDIVTIPTDLSPGDRYRLVFVTDGTRDGTSADITDYDAFVAAQAEAVSTLSDLGTVWRVIGSIQSPVGTWNAHDHTGTNPMLGEGVPIYTLDGVRIADNNADLWDGNLDAPILITPSGESSSGSPFVWTGTNPDGTASTGFLGRNPVTSPDDLSAYGLSTATDWQWISAGNADNILLSYRLYGISAELIAIPEPAPGVLVLLGLSLMIWRRRDPLSARNAASDKTLKESSS